MGKHKHIVSFKAADFKETTIQIYTYSFGKTKNVTLSICEGYFAITAELGKTYDSEKILTKDSYLFADGIKKGMLLHFVLFSKSIDIDTIEVKIDDQVVKKTQKEAQLVYSMIDGELIRPMNIEWKKEEIESILAQKKSNNDSRFSSLNALICSKSKHFEAERFMYLWMAFNGMYGYFTMRVMEKETCNGGKGKKKKRECDQLRYMQQLFKWGNETISDDVEKSRIAHATTAIIRSIDTPVTIKELTEKESILVMEIEKLLVKPDNEEKYDFTCLGYFITQYAYYYRCKLFHANQPLALLSFQEEAEVLALKAINNVLEEFIEAHLHKWFNNDYVTREIDKEAESISKVSNKKKKKQENLN